MLLIILSTVLTLVNSWYFPESKVPRYNDYLGVHDGSEHAAEFLNEWTVVVDGGEDVAQLIALQLGYVFGGPVQGFPNTYNFIKYEHDIERRTSPEASGLIKDKRVRWAEQSFGKMRVKRYPASEDEKELVRVKRLEEANTSITEHSKRSINNMPSLLFNDELWTKEWYLQDTRSLQNVPRLDLNVLTVYAMGFNGSGVRVSILDDGIEHAHTDLRSNYDPEISWDCNDRDSDPTPRKEALDRNSHGTRCAGEIAMTANNVKCGVGVAWGAKVGGVRMLDGRITDRVEAEAIGYAWDKVDIYSASWGPNDDGRTVEGPGRMAAQALERGIILGRGGKGSIYVWANGNGGGHQDNCNCDGYSSSIYTISIGSASQHGLFPWYGEICASTLATAYSSGAYSDQKIVTTDVNNTCTLSHTGTSAAAPLAAGIIALALQANPKLTWRDVQHLIVWTSEYAPLSANPGWQINSVGLRFDVRFGFGLLNAGALVTRALSWVNVPEKHVCRVDHATLLSKILRPGNPVYMEINVSDCLVNYIEHVQLIVNVHYTCRGALEVSLTSPRGTKVQLLSPRPRDISSAGFVNWPLMSVAAWGENPIGVWRVSFEDNSMSAEQNSGHIGKTTLVIHGSQEIPDHMKNGGRTYDYDIDEYRDDFGSYDFDTSIDDVNVLPGVHNGVGGEVIELSPSVMDDVEQELQRYHHRVYKAAAGGNQPVNVV